MTPSELELKKANIFQYFRHILSPKIDDYKKDLAMYGMQYCQTKRTNFQANKKQPYSQNFAQIYCFWIFKVTKDSYEIHIKSSRYLQDQ